MSKHILSKSTFIRGVQCQKSLYLHKHRPFLRDKMSAEQLAKFRRGTDVGLLAQSLFPGGTDMSPRSPSQYALKVKETALAIENPNTKVLYEAVFQYDDVLVMLDILVRTNEGWHAYEVKSSLSLSETYYTDAALQYFVLTGSGIRLTDFSLVYINSNYQRYGVLNLEELFVSESVMAEADRRQQEVAARIIQSKQTLLGTSSPEIQIGIQCNKPYPCDFKGLCWKKVPKHSVLNLTAIDDETKFAWYHQGIVTPEQLKLSDLNQLQIKQLGAIFDNSYYIDLEKLYALRDQTKATDLVYAEILFQKPAVPQFDGCIPYQLFPLAIGLSWGEQESIMVAYSPGEAGIIRFIDTLYDALTIHKTLVVFDKQPLEIFARQFEAVGTPESKDKLRSLLENTLGLTGLLQACDFFHPDCGSGITLATLYKVIAPDQKALRDIHWLMSELIADPDLFKQQNSLQYVMENTLAIKAIFTYFSASDT
ncbi:MAG: hypothetical protein KGZ82_13700 [Bacteroidales bacterium]|nr:hypothetical protein [Bacteroidales bacterium]